MKDGGSEVCEYVVLHTDGCLVISDHAGDILKKDIDRYLNVRPGYIGPPSLYLVGYLRLVKDETGTKSWALSSTQYVQSTVMNMENYPTQDGKALTAKAIDVLRKGCCPKNDISEDLGPGEVS